VNVCVIEDYSFALLAFGLFTFGAASLETALLSQLHVIIIQWQAKRRMWTLKLLSLNVHGIRLLEKKESFVYESFKANH